MPNRTWVKALYLPLLAVWLFALFQPFAQTLALPSNLLLFFAILLQVAIQVLLRSWYLRLPAGLLVWAFSDLILGVEGSGAPGELPFYANLETYWQQRFENIALGLQQLSIHDNPEMILSTFVILFYPELSWLLVGLCAMLFAEIAVRRQRVLPLFAAGLVVLGMMDAFGGHRLEWPFVVFTGVGVVLLALAQYERVAAATSVWRGFLSRFLLPALVASLCIVGIGWAAPSANPAWPDPLHGHVFGQAGLGAKTIGYSKDDSKLGGGLSESDALVMTVTAQQPTLWRGESKDFYTGHGWIGNEAELVAKVPSSALDTAGASGHALGSSAYVRLSATLPELMLPWPTRSFPRLFGTEWVDGQARADDLGMELDPESGAVRLPNRSVQAGSQYGVVWQPPDYTPQQLRNSSRGPFAWDDPENIRQAHGLDTGSVLADQNGLPQIVTQSQADAPASVQESLQAPSEQLLKAAPALQDPTLWNAWAPYLQLPSELPQRVYQLADQIIADATKQAPGESLSLYDKALAIQQYLNDSQHFQYTLHPPAIDPRRDFVDQFLFDTHTGYCDYFSSAMVVLLRAEGIPARWVKGFAPGTQVGTHQYEVRARDAHSWVEVFLPQVGWVAFDPTPGFSSATPWGEAALPVNNRSMQHPPATQEEHPRTMKPAPTIPQQAESLAAASTKEGRDTEQLPFWPIATGGSLFVVALIAALLLRRHWLPPLLWGSVCWRDEGLSEVRRTADRAMRRMVIICRLFGAVDPTRLPVAWAQSLIRAFPQAAGAADAFVESYERLRFGPRPSKADVRKLREDGLALIVALRQPAVAGGQVTANTEEEEARRARGNG
ncbi:MAG: transglutaminase domain-containing protein [Firmicutes bacterium]|nr:transglutaminase domain-containing protein [Bacillota bacterium]